jgi:hypothetical protein
MPSELAGQSNGLLPAEFLYSVAGGFLLKNASIAFNMMNAEATAAGYPLTVSDVNNTYRKLSVQDSYFRERYDHTPRLNTGGVVWYQGLPWWRKPGATTAAVPGSSNHGWGLAIDVVGAEGGRLAWLLANAARFGFSWEIQDELWHIRYVLGDDLPAGTTPPPHLPQTKDFDVSTTTSIPNRRPNTPDEDPVFDFTFLRANGEGVDANYYAISQLFIRQLNRDTPPRDKVVAVWFAGVAVPVPVPKDGQTTIVDVQRAGFCSVGFTGGPFPCDPAIGLYVEHRELILPK